MPAPYMACMPYETYNDQFFHGLTVILFFSCSKTTPSLRSSMVAALWMVRPQYPTFSNLCHPIDLTIHPDSSNVFSLPTSVKYISYLNIVSSAKPGFNLEMSRQSSISHQPEGSIQRQAVIETSLILSSSGRIHEQGYAHPGRLEGPAPALC